MEDGFKSQTTIFSKHDIFARMVSNAWYTVNYFHVSFGKLDNLQTAINTIKNTEGLTVDADKKEIVVEEGDVTILQYNEEDTSTFYGHIPVGKQVTAFINKKT
jgi:predicted YcjX-like family ATPase